MRRHLRLVSTTALAAAVLTVAPLSASIGSTASAASASISAVGSWVYPGHLNVTISGSPEKPYSEGDFQTGDTGHGVSWSVSELAPSQPCPTAASDLNGDSTIAYGTPTGTTFAETDKNVGGFQDDRPVHLCGLMVESDSTGPVVTATSDTPVPARVRNYGLRINGGGYYLKKQYHMRVIGQCQDFWPNGKHLFTSGCPLAAKVVMTVSKRVKNQLGLPSRLLGTVKLVPYTGTVERTELALTAAGRKAAAHWKDSDVATLKATSTSPIAMSKSRSTGLTELFGFDSWRTSTSDSGGD